MKRRILAFILLLAMMAGSIIPAMADSGPSVSTSMRGNDVTITVKDGSNNHTKVVAFEKNKTVVYDVDGYKVRLEYNGSKAKSSNIIGVPTATKSNNNKKDVDKGSAIGGNSTAVVFDGSTVYAEAEAVDEQEPVTKDGVKYADIIREPSDSSANWGTKISANGEVYDIKLNGKSVGGFVFNKQDAYIVITLTDDVSVDIRWDCSDYYAVCTLDGAGVYKIPRLLKDNGDKPNFNQIWITPAKSNEPIDYTGTLAIDKTVDGVNFGTWATDYDGNISVLINDIYFELYKVANNGSVVSGQPVGYGFLEQDQFVGAKISFKVSNNPGAETLEFAAADSGWYAVVEKLGPTASTVFEDVGTKYFFVNINEEGTINVGSGGNDFDKGAFYKLTYDLGPMFRLNYPGLNGGGEIFPIELTNIDTEEKYPSFCAHGNSQRFGGDNDLNCEYYVEANDEFDYDISDFLSAFNYIEDTYGSVSDNIVITQTVIWVLLGDIDVDSPSFAASGLTDAQKADVKDVVENSKGYTGGPISELVYMVCDKYPNHNFEKCQPQLVPVYGGTSFDNKEAEHCHNEVSFKKVKEVDGKWVNAEDGEFVFDLYRIDDEGNLVHLGTYHTKDGFVTVNDAYETWKFQKDVTYVFIEQPDPKWEIEDYYKNGIFFEMVSTGDGSNLLAAILTPPPSGFGIRSLGVTIINEEKLIYSSTVTFNKEKNNGAAVGKDEFKFDLYKTDDDWNIEGEKLGTYSTEEVLGGYGTVTVYDLLEPWNFEEGGKYVFIEQPNDDWEIEDAYKNGIFFEMKLVEEGGKVLYADWRDSESVSMTVSNGLKFGSLTVNVDIDAKHEKITTQDIKQREVWNIKQRNVWDEYERNIWDEYERNVWDVYEYTVQPYDKPVFERPYIKIDKAVDGTLFGAWSSNYSGNIYDLINDIYFELYKVYSAGDVVSGLPIGYGFLELDGTIGFRVDNNRDSAALKLTSSDSGWYAVVEILGPVASQVFEDVGTKYFYIDIDGAGNSTVTGGSIPKGPFTIQPKLIRPQYSVSFPEGR